MGHNYLVETAYNEFKYTLNPRQVLRFLKFLKCRYGDTDSYPTGWIETVYFDSMDRKCFQETLSGQVRKLKFRVRNYVGTNSLQLQLKSKNLYEVRKLKLSLKGHRLHRLPPWHLCCQETPLLLLPSFRFGILRPALKITYFRHRFRLFNFRVNVDEKISVQSFSHLGNLLPLKYFFPISVFEVKTNMDHPVAPFSLNFDLPQNSFSKFGIGMGILKHIPGVTNKYVAS